MYTPIDPPEGAEQFPQITLRRVFADVRHSDLRVVLAHWVGAASIAATHPGTSKTNLPARRDVLPSPSDAQAHHARTSLLMTPVT